MLAPAMVYGLFFLGLSSFCGENGSRARSKDWPGVRARPRQRPIHVAWKRTGSIQKRRRRCMKTNEVCQAFRASSCNVYDGRFDVLCKILSQCFCRSESQPRNVLCSPLGRARIDGMWISIGRCILQMGKSCSFLFVKGMDWAFGFG